MQLFQWNHISALFYDSVVCFLLPKCAFFYQCCLSGLSSQHCVSMIFVITVLVKKCTPCQGVVWFSPSKCHIFYTSGFSVVLYLHNWSPLKPQNKLQKKSRALPSSSRLGLRAPDPVNPSFEKMTSQPTCFCCAYFPKSVMNLHRLFNISCINTHFDMFFKN